MTEKRLILIVPLLSALILFAGCTNGQQSSENDTSPVQQNDNTQRSRGGFGQRPDLMGKVQSVAGNEVTIQVAEMPERPQGERRGPQNGQNPADGQQQSLQGQGQPPQGERPNMDSEQRQQMMQETLKLTDKTEKLSIPEGTEISGFSRGDNEEKLSISDIKEGTLIQIYYEEGTKTIKSIRIMGN